MEHSASQSQHENNSESQGSQTNLNNSHQNETSRILSVNSQQRSSQATYNYFIRNNLVKKLKNLYCVVGKEEKIHLIVCDTESSNSSSLKFVKTLQRKFMFPKNKKHLEACFKVPKTLRLKYKKGKNRKRMSEHVKGSYIGSEITNNSAVLVRESPTRSIHQVNEMVSENSHNSLCTISYTEFKDGRDITEINDISNVDTKAPCDGKIFCYKRKSLSTLINFKILSEKTFKSLRNESDFMGGFENVEILNLSSYNTLIPVVSHFPKLLTSSFSDEDSPKDNFICHCSLRNMKSDFRSTLELPQSLDFRSMNSLLKSVLDTKDIARAMKLCEKDLHFGTNLNNLNSEVEGVIRIKVKELNGIKEFCCDVKYRAKGLETPHIIEDSELQEDKSSSSSMSEGVRPKNLNLFSKDCSESERRKSLKALCQLKLKSLDDRTWDIDEYLPSKVKKSSKTTHRKNVREESTNGCSELTFSPDENYSDLKSQRTESSSLENKCQDLVEVKYIQLSMSIVLALVLHAVQSISQIMLEVFLVTDPPSPPW